MIVLDMTSVSEGCRKSISVKGGDPDVNLPVIEAVTIIAVLTISI